MQPLADPAVAAVAGNTKVGNRSGLLGRWQHIEYVMGVYRQMMYLVAIESSISALIGVRAGGKHIPRTGDIVLPETPTPV